MSRTCRGLCILYLKVSEGQKVGCLSSKPGTQFCLYSKNMQWKMASRMSLHLRTNIPNILSDIFRLYRLSAPVSNAFPGPAFPALILLFPRFFSGPSLPLKTPLLTSHSLERWIISLINRLWQWHLWPFCFCQRPRTLKCPEPHPLFLYPFWG